MLARAARRTPRRPLSVQRRSTAQRPVQMHFATKNHRARSSPREEDSSDHAILSGPACGFSYFGKDAAVGPLVIAACVAPRMFLAIYNAQGANDVSGLTTERRAKLHGRSTAFNSLLVYADIIKNTANCIQTLEISPQELDLYTRSREPLDKIVLITAKKLLNTLAFPHWRELHGPPGFGEKLRLLYPTYTVREDNSGFVAAAHIIARLQREDAVKEIEKQVGMPLGTGDKDDPPTKAYLQTLESTPVTKRPPFVRTLWP